MQPRHPTTCLPAPVPPSTHLCLGQMVGQVSQLSAIHGVTLPDLHAHQSSPTARAYLTLGWIIPIELYMFWQVAEFRHSKRGTGHIRALKAHSWILLQQKVRAQVTMTSNRDSIGGFISKPRICKLKPSSIFNSPSWKSTD